MRRIKTVNYQGITGSGQTVDLSYGIFDPAYLTTADDVIFNGAGAPSRGEVPRGNPYLDSVPGDFDQFNPSGIETATAPKGETPTE